MNPSGVPCHHHLCHRSQVRLWDAVTGDTLVEYRGHDNFVFCVDQHEHMIVSGSFDETVKIWDVSGTVLSVNRLIG